MGKRVNKEAEQNANEFARRFKQNNIAGQGGDIQNKLAPLFFGARGKTKKMHRRPAGSRRR